MMRSHEPRPISDLRSSSVGMLPVGPAPKYLLSQSGGQRAVATYGDESEPRMDVVSAERRSSMMAGIRGRDTKPEMLVRRLVHSMGYRYRLRRRDLPGRPDLVFASRRKVIF